MANATILVRASSRVSGELEWVEPGEEITARSFPHYEASAPGRPIRMGTEQLLRVAVALRDFGFRATHLQLVNSSMLPLADPSLEQRVREDAITLLRQAQPDDVLSYFRRSARGVYVVAIEMRVAKGGGRVTLRRDGWITVHDTGSTPLVKSSLQETSELVGIV